jgi:hypothetical protein
VGLPAALAAAGAGSGADLVLIVSPFQNPDALGFPSDSFDAVFSLALYACC